MPFIVSTGLVLPPFYASHRGNHLIIRGSRLPTPSYRVDFGCMLLFSSHDRLAMCRCLPSRTPVPRRHLAAVPRCPATDRCRVPTVSREGSAHGCECPSGHPEVACSTRRIMDSGSGMIIACPRSPSRRICTTIMKGVERMGERICQYMVRSMPWESQSLMFPA